MRQPTWPPVSEQYPEFPVCGVGFCGPDGVGHLTLSMNPQGLGITVPRGTSMPVWLTRAEGERLRDLLDQWLAAVA